MRMYHYIRAFLTDCTAPVEVNHLRTKPVQTPNSGTPQGAVLSAILFNIGMMKLLQELRIVPGLQHVMYTGDVTTWAVQGSIGFH
ncbi:hypothetical protein HPB49_001680 [Dermacentor silvarum]|uniref:Uncharacterized protein n=1 Tax=Dermacentor silvarum TaxID=543639 RepID=A0ACB8CJ73_DERSI|nr:hypothetical protein HPB49_001680 [Dermacentor silvarum]